MESVCVTSDTAIFDFAQKSDMRLVLFVQKQTHSVTVISSPTYWHAVSAEWRLLVLVRTTHTCTPTHSHMQVAAHKSAQLDFN